MTVADGPHILSPCGPLPDVSQDRYRSATEQLNLISFLFQNQVPGPDDGCWAGLCACKAVIVTHILQYSGTVKMNICLRAISTVTEDVNKQKLFLLFCLYGTV